MHAPFPLWGRSHRRVLQYTSKTEAIHVHLSRVTRCPGNFPAGYFWYGDRRHGPGQPSKCITEEVPCADNSSPDNPAGELSESELASEFSESKQDELKEGSDMEDGQMVNHFETPHGRCTRSRTKYLHEDLSSTGRASRSTSIEL